MSDNVEHPSHYNAGSVETIDGIRAALGDAFLDYCRGNVLKYVWRCRHKGKLLEDLRKAAKYLEWAIAEAESEKPSKPQELAIPDGWRELNQGELLSVHDLYELNGEWTACKHDPLGDRYNSRIHKRHIRKIETPEPEPLAIPDGWRELEENEPLCEDDLFELDGEWVGHEYDPSGGTYSSRIHRRHIRKIETADTSEMPNSSIPDPGEGYRLLSKDPPERVVEGDEYLAFDGEWSESENWRHGSSPQTERFYYRRKIEPTEWIPKVGDRVRVVGNNPKLCGDCAVVYEVDSDGLVARVVSYDGRRDGWLPFKDLEPVEAAS